jgi:hypothetical protein
MSQQCLVADSLVQASTLQEALLLSSQSYFTSYFTFLF